MQPYRGVLAIPRVRASMLLMFFARLPMTAMSIALALHVLSDLGLGYGPAGLVGTATMLGSALGAPTLGRLIDRYGLRPVVACSGACSTAFWVSTPHLPYLVLVTIAFPAGMLAVPAGSLARQVLAALVPERQRRAAFTLDTISVEASFMIGPSVSVLVSIQLSSTTALTGIGIWFTVAATALCLVNPPIREQDRFRAELRPRWRTWLTGRLIAALLIAVGALFTLVGTEVAVLAALRASKEVSWTGVVIALMSAASIVGGFVHGAVRRSLSQSTLMLLLGLLVIPAGLFDQPWWLLAIALIPMNLLCTPTLAATTETISKLAPPRVRGEAMGLQDSATRLGLALGAPVVGFAIDHSSPAWGFATAGVGGLAIASVGMLSQRGSSGLIHLPGAKTGAQARTKSPL